MKIILFTALFFALTLNSLSIFASPAVALAKEGAQALSSKPCFALAKEGAQALSSKPSFAMALFIEPAFAKATAGKGDPNDIKVVVSQKRIWLVADEMPMKCLKAHIKNSEGKIVLEKCFSSKGAEWFLNIEALPKGNYTLHLGADQVEKFKK